MTTLERVAPTESKAPQRECIGFWLAITLLALIAAQKVVLVDTLDPDAFWHLRVADQIAHDGVGPLVDQLSYMSKREPWTPYSWLAELGMRLVWHAAGLRGAVISHMLMAMALVILSALACRTTSSRRRDLPVVVGVLFAGIWTQWFVAFRPVSAAFVLLAVCAWLLLRDRRMNARSHAIWLVPPVVVLAINLHFFTIVVPCWIGALLLGALIERDRRGARRYALLLIASSLALLATSMLPGMIRAMTNFAGDDPLVASGTILEMTYVWRQGWGVVLTILAIATIALLVVNRSQIRAGEWIWLIGMTLLAARYARFMPLFAMIAAPLLAQTLPAMSARVLSLRVVWAMLAIVIVPTTVRVIASLPSPNAPDQLWLNRHGPQRFGFPCEAADFVAARVTPHSGHLINGFNWGGYLAWRLPQFKVMSDARTQLYPPEFWEMYFFSDAETTKMALAELIAEKGADAAVLPRDDQHFQPRLIELGWTIAHQDDRAVVLIPVTSDRN